ncbi:OsmC family protein [Pseudoalteromonas luteoviolacea]|uniref:Peroxiredoxin n=1 Tax=Pseudoalteromonas luteoviolacea S4054 TaxID=1129367 RepID=A0A0F6A7S7_9GAMM|nr:OsmC family protein [Pseudoalteromonas luteoviolacea]AOT10991.1 peroxiredoxin [Pseudoalteromonas luteoviolacea]AOT15845.1 peroxiredoxin [Pseudoalteromonas luteoviolacea]AOT20812.1 peroxiredoxin [Pseudoalteromonas luteoviolacea]KKE81891.1 hypothetical protein N479_20875 [Pseudoalteromonas luteoviolacea S4054]KZN72222.1 hypothetical protein N481_16170 [Pseudoalteromonas luteoviolacea S4047-1]
MSIYQAAISWQRQANEAFIDAKYSRAHIWSFDGGAIVEASSSPSVVPLPYSVEHHVDPEEAYVASISSCHMLFFLHFAAKAKLVVESYIDNASGIMARNAQGNMAMVEVTLKPQVTWYQPELINDKAIAELHHQAHQSCFIANSVNTLIKIEH